MGLMKETTSAAIDTTAIHPGDLMGGQRRPVRQAVPHDPADDAVAARPEPSCAWTVEIPSATRSQMELLAAALRERGITGTIKCKGVC